MTYRDFYTAIANADLPAELIEFANTAITALDHKNDLRKGKPSKDKIESEARRQAVAELMKDGIVRNRTEVATALGITAGQATSALTALVKGEVLVKDTVRKDKTTVTIYSIKE